MIGNDIVDLAQAKQESNWRRKGYLDKIFTEHEQQLILEANDPDQLVWLLWSMKESAYKLAVRRTNERVFAPKKIACQLHESTTGMISGTVSYGDNYHCKSTVTSQYISTIALPAKEAQDYTQVIISFETAVHQAHQHIIRQRIKQHISALFSTSEHNIHLAKDNLGAPLLTVGTSNTIPISISHHGLYGAFVIGKR